MGALSEQVFTVDKRSDVLKPLFDVGVAAVLALQLTSGVGIRGVMALHFWTGPLPSELEAETARLLVLQASSAIIGTYPTHTCEVGRELLPYPQAEGKRKPDPRGLCRRIECSEPEHILQIHAY